MTIVVVVAVADTLVARSLSALISHTRLPEIERLVSESSLPIWHFLAQSRTRHFRWPSF